MTRWIDLSSSVEPAAGHYFYSIAIDPSDENRVYTGGRYFYRTDDGGGTWNKDMTYLYNVQEIAVDPLDSKRVYVVGPETFYTSENYGQTFVPHDDCFSGNPSVLEVAPATPSTLYLACSNGGLFRSDDWGGSWEEAHHGISTYTIASMALAPSQPETIFVNIQNSSTIMGSYDCGGSFEKLTYPQGCSGTINDLWVRSTEPNEIVALEAG
ncbi:MAG: hypothetical protein KJ645_02845 [Planctomycetes bacterium]|nr:hypothetical protein [Planctomycetota bacterium]